MSAGIPALSVYNTFSPEQIAFFFRPAKIFFKKLLHDLLSCCCLIDTRLCTKFIKLIIDIRGKLDIQIPCILLFSGHIITSSTRGIIPAASYQAYLLSHTPRHRRGGYCAF